MAAINEQSRENVTVIACSLNNSPDAPCIYTMGIKTTIVVSVDAIIAPPTCDVPSTEASFPDLPSS